jgi:hypothetical protein
MAGTITEDLNAAVDLQFARVVNHDGGMIGHLFDLRCEWHPPSARAEVTHLICGRRGLLERLGFRERFVTIPWNEVIEVREREIVVRASRTAARV